MRPFFLYLIISNSKSRSYCLSAAAIPARLPHGFRSLKGVAINHDVNHLTVLGRDQMEPFMNDPFDWPQWPALDVSDSGVIEYCQSMASLGSPVGLNLENPSTPVVPSAPREDR